MSFKGYAGTLGLDEVTSLLSDRVVTPPEYQDYYIERFVMMPASYHYNGHDHLYPHVHGDGGNGPFALPSKYDVSKGKYSMYQEARQTELLSSRAASKDSILLCNFNQFYKFVPRYWAIWMDLLKAHPSTVLWLLSWTEAGKESLIKHAAVNGVSKNRLEFTTFFKEEDHVLAKGICDVFLDANPYASHGTAADALYTGVPLITVPAETMASRVSTRQQSRTLPL
jgi:predicted O-linked N-acetylglucosamine transferase (SPINDLY family)